MNPVFSILLPTYKRQFLAACIDSIMAQTYPNWELIIVNDASPEDIESVVLHYNNDPRIQYARNTKNYGAERLVEQWNYCLSLAQGDYVICMGDDDRMAVDGLATYARLIDRYPQVHVLHGQTDIIDANDQLVCHTDLRPEWESAISMLYYRTFDRRKQFIGDFCFKRQELVQRGGFYNLPYAWGSDDISALEAAQPHGIANTREVVFFYRDNEASITRHPHILGKLRAVLLEAMWKRRFLSRQADDVTDRTYQQQLKRKLLYITLIKCYYIIQNAY